MDSKNKWLDVARAIALKIDGPQPESKEPEVRVNATSFEVRAEGDGMTFTGYASVFNSPSEDLGGFIEYVAPGAFKRILVFLLVRILILGMDHMLTQLKQTLLLILFLDTKD
jgi:hypothetical protein